ncbi:MAG TPA: (2Fe-2S)-binding protein [Jatrophihabitans sp.]|nr:(2Fe-2S)-binding protein [Jatrophihabitans sp.]
MRILAELGPFFEVTLHADRPAAPWQPLAGLADSPALAGRLAEVRTRLGVDARVAASVAQLGLVARLVAPVLALAARGGGVLDLAAGCWRPPLDGTVALSLPAARSREPLATALTAGPIADLSAACGRLGRLSPRVLAGNLASAVNGAALQLGPRAYPAAAELLAAVSGEDGAPGPGFARRSCCLLYRAAGGGCCGDCVLARP